MFLCDVRFLFCNIQQLSCTCPYDPLSFPLVIPPLLMSHHRLIKFMLPPPSSLSPVLPSHVNFLLVSRPGRALGPLFIPQPRVLLLLMSIPSEPCCCASIALRSFIVTSIVPTTRFGSRSSHNQSHQPLDHSALVRCFRRICQGRPQRSL